VQQILLFFCLSALLFQTIGRGEPITVSAGSSTLELGSNASIDFYINGLANGTAPSVGVYDLTVSFDPSILSFSSVGWGTGLDVFGLGDIQSATLATGTIELFELSLDSSSDLNAFQSDAFRLFTLTFVADASGTSPLDISVNALGDADGVSLPANIEGGSITVGQPSAVPEHNEIIPILVTCGYLTRRRKALGLIG
jgi:hypothetical protein